MARIVPILIVALAAASPAAAQSVPGGFTDEVVFNGNQTNIKGIFCIRFAPDGRMFFSEWRTGFLRVATYNAGSGTWNLLSTPFHAFRTPDSNAGSPTARRGTLRGFDFDPNFSSNGYIYATYMHDSDRTGYRIVRIKTSSTNANRSDGGETVFLRCRFHPDGHQPDAHNGGGLVVGGDNKLYVSFGDGWTTSSSQDMTVFAGKIVRLNLNGSIPTDNIWYGSLSGDLRAIVALGQRNPICLTRHPVSGRVYVNGFTGSNKSAMHQFTQGANYQHGGTGGGGTPKGEWINTSLNASGNAWAAWYPAGGSWPAQYHNNAFVVNWRGNGEILRVTGGESNPSKQTFATNLQQGNLSSSAAAIGPDGNLYYTIREYGELTHLRRIRSTSGPALPSVSVSVDASTVSEGGSTTVRVTRSGDTSQSITVNLSRAGSATSGSDYTGIPTSVTISSGSTQATRTLSIVDDTETENNETVIIQIQSGSGYTVGAPNSATVTIPANDTPPPSVSISTDATVVAEGGSTTIRVTRSGDTSQAISVNLSVGGSATSGSDYGALPASITISGGATQATRTLSVTDDTETENDETVIVQVQSGSGYTVGAPSSSTVTIPANDTPLPSITVAADTPTVPEGNSTTIRLTRSGDTSQSVSVAVSTAGNASSGSDYGAVPGSVTINSGQTEGSFTLSILDDTEAEGDETVVVQLQTGAGYTVGNPGTTTVTIPVNDQPSGYGLTTRGSVGAYLDGVFPSSGTGTMPATLSSTGAFTNLASMTPRSGLNPFTVNSPLWSDFAAKTRWVAVPDGQTVTFSATGGYDFPIGTVLVKHFSLPTDDTNASVLTRLETRFLVKGGATSWYGVTYLWRADESDADLLGAAGATQDYTIQTAGGGTRQQTWTFPSRGMCLQCHTTTAGFALGVNTRQLNGNYYYTGSGITDNQLRSWSHVGLLDQTLSDPQIAGYDSLVPVTSGAASLEERVRSYLDANCAQCHHPGGPGQGNFDARYDTPLASQGIINGAVLQTMGIEGAVVVKPQDAWRSMLYQRMDLRGPAEQMPTIGTHVRDADALNTVLAWIDSLSGSPALAPPQISPAPGTYPAPLTVTASHSDSSAVLRYTLDGSIPTASSPVFPGGGIALTSTTTVRVNAWRTGYATSVSSIVSYTVQGGGGGGTNLPSPWQGLDIGAVGLAGTGLESGGTFMLSGSGADIWGTQDEFYYAYVSLPGDGSIVARVTSQGNTNAWAKAGVMLRASLTPASPHAMMAITPGNGLAYQRRVTAGGTSATTSGGAASPPWWLRVERDGNQFTAYASADGITWSLVGSDTIAMVAQVYAGLAVTSHDNAQSSAADFDGIMVVLGKDTDGDGMSDAAETAAGFDPANGDEDTDGLVDGLNDWDSNGVLNHLQYTAGGGPGPGPGPGPAGAGNGGSSGGSCGLTGLEALFGLGLLGLLRRRRR